MPIPKLDVKAWAANVPPAMRSVPNWVGHLDKRPVNPRTGEPAAVDDPATWGTFEDAKKFYMTHRADSKAGVGFVFTAALELVFIDFDHCIDERHALKEWAKPLVEPFVKAGAYIELSPSGTGLHVFGRASQGDAPAGKRAQAGPTKEEHVEVYHAAHYSTVTGSKPANAPRGQLRSIDTHLFRLRERLPALKGHEAPAAEPSLPANLRALSRDLDRLFAALPVLATKYDSLDYDTWWQKFAAPLQGSFGGTPLEPAARRLFADITKKLPGYNPGDERKFDDFKRTGGTKLTVASIFKEADEVDSKWRLKYREQAAEEDIAAAPIVIVPEGLEAFETEERLKPTAWVCEPYLPRAELIELHGPHGAFKSTVALYAVLAVASGTPWCNAPTVKGKAAFVTLEDDGRVIAHRVKAWRVREGFEREGAPERGETIRGRFFALGREKARELQLVEIRYGEAVEIEANVSALVEAFKGFSLVVVETSARLASGPEDNPTLARLAFALERFASQSGACVMLIRHVSKEAAKSGPVQSYSGRGGGALADAARGVLSIRREDDEAGLDAPITLVHTKPYALAPTGPNLVWRPRVGPAGLYLDAATATDTEVSTDRVVLRHLREAGEGGMTWDMLRSKVRSGKGRDERREALRAGLDRLVERGTVRKEAATRGARYFVAGEKEEAACPTRE